MTIPESLQTHFVFALILATTVANARNRMRYDLIALLVMLSLMVTGVLTSREALAYWIVPLLFPWRGLNPCAN